MPDALHWLGIRRIDRFVSMSDTKHDAITSQDIEIGERVEIPESLVPTDARVEIDAKLAAGYHSGGAAPDAAELAVPKGRGLGD
jgi:GTP cyclohydrolase II